MNYALTITIAITVLILVAAGLYISKKEMFQVSVYPFTESSDAKPLETLYLNTDYGHVSAHLTPDNTLKIMANLPLPDGGDYSTSQKKYAVYSGKEKLGDLLRSQDGYFYFSTKIDTKKISLKEINVVSE